MTAPTPLPKAPLRLPNLQKSYEQFLDPREYGFLYYKDENIDTRVDFLIGEGKSRHNKQRQQAQKLLDMVRDDTLDINNIYFEVLDDEFNKITHQGDQALDMIATHQGAVITPLSNVMANVVGVRMPDTIIDLNAYQRAGVVNPNPISPSRYNKETPDPDDVHLVNLWDNNHKAFTNPIYLQSAQHYGQVAKQAVQRSFVLTNNEFSQQQRQQAEQDLEQNLTAFQRTIINFVGQNKQPSYLPEDYLTLLYDGSLKDRDGRVLKNDKDKNLTFNQLIYDMLPARVSDYMSGLPDIGTPSRKGGQYYKTLDKMVNNPNSRLNPNEKHAISQALTLMQQRNVIIQCNDTLKDLSAIKHADPRGIPAVPYNYGTNTGRQTNLSSINFVGMSENVKQYLHAKQEGHFVADYDVSSLEYMTVILATGNQMMFDDYIQGQDVYMVTGLKMEQTQPRKSITISHQGQTTAFDLAQMVNNPNLHETFKAKAQQDWGLQEQDISDNTHQKWAIVQQALTQARKNPNHPDHDLAQSIRQEGKVASLMFNYGAGSVRIAQDYNMQVKEVDKLKDIYFKMNDYQVSGYHKNLDGLLNLVASGQYNHNNQNHKTLLESCQVYNRLDKDYLAGKTQAPLMVGFDVKDNNLVLRFRNGLPETLLDIKKENGKISYTSPDGEQKDIYGASLFAHCIQGLSARIMQGQDWTINKLLKDNGLDKHAKMSLAIHDSKAFNIEQGNEASCVMIRQAMSMAGVGYENTKSAKENLFGQACVFRTSETVGKNLTGEVCPDGSEVLPTIERYHQIQADKWREIGCDFSSTQLHEVDVRALQNPQVNMSVENHQIQQEIIRQEMESRQAEQVYEAEFEEKTTTFEQSLTPT